MTAKTRSTKSEIRNDETPERPAPFQALVPTERIRWAGNPRKTFDEAELAKLTESVRANGILHPLLVRPLPHSAARSWRPPTSPTRRPPITTSSPTANAAGAARAAGLPSLPVVVRIGLTDAEMLELSVTTFEQRQDVSALEKAAAYLRLHQGHHWTVARIASTSAARRRECAHAPPAGDRLPPLAREAVAKGLLAPTTAAVITRLPTPESRERLALEVLADARWQGKNVKSLAKEARQCVEAGAPPYTLRETLDWVEAHYLVELKRPPSAKTMPTSPRPEAARPAPSVPAMPPICSRACHRHVHGSGVLARKVRPTRSASWRRSGPASAPGAEQEGLRCALPVGRPAKQFRLCRARRHLRRRQAPPHLSRHRGRGSRHDRDRRLHDGRRHTLARAADVTRAMKTRHPAGRQGAADRLPGGAGRRKEEARRRPGPQRGQPPHPGPGRPGRRPHPGPSTASTRSCARLAPRLPGRPVDVQPGRGPPPTARTRTRPAMADKLKKLLDASHRAGRPDRPAQPGRRPVHPLERQRRDGGAACRPGDRPQGRRDGAPPREKDRRQAGRQQRTGPRCKRLHRDRRPASAASAAARRATAGSAPATGDACHWVNDKQRDLSSACLPLMEADLGPLLKAVKAKARRSSASTASARSATWSSSRSARSGSPRPSRPRSTRPAAPGSTTASRRRRGLRDRPADPICACCGEAIGAIVDAIANIDADDDLIPADLVLPAADVILGRERDGEAYLACVACGKPAQTAWRPGPTVSPAHAAKARK